MEIIFFLRTHSLRGFENLLLNEPTLIEHIKNVPDALYITRLLYISFGKPLITSTHEDEIFEKCKLIIDNLKKNKEHNSHLTV